MSRPAVAAANPPASRTAPLLPGGYWTLYVGSLRLSCQTACRTPPSALMSGKNWCPRAVGASSRGVAQLLPGASKLGWVLNGDGSNNLHEARAYSIPTILAVVDALLARGFEFTIPTEDLRIAAIRGATREAAPIPEPQVTS